MTGIYSITNRWPDLNDLQGVSRNFLLISASQRLLDLQGYVYKLGKLMGNPVAEEGK
jgi:hypothetical protein